MLDGVLGGDRPHYDLPAHMIPRSDRGIPKNATVKQCTAAFAIAGEDDRSPATQMARCWMILMLTIEPSDDVRFYGWAPFGGDHGFIAGGGTKYR